MLLKTPKSGYLAIVGIEDFRLKESNARPGSACTMEVIAAFQKARSKVAQRR